MSQDLKTRVENALEEIRPFLQTDGGDIRLLDIKDDVVVVELLGTCTGCTVNQMTLKSGVEMTVKKHAPEIKQVINQQS